MCWTVTYFSRAVVIKFALFFMILTVLAGLGLAQGEPNIRVSGDVSFPTADFQEGVTTNTHFRIKNRGDAPLTVFSILFTDSVFSVLDPVPPFDVSPGASLEVLLQFAPTEPGAESGELHLESNDPDEPLIIVSVFGETIVDDQCSLTTIGVTPLNDMSGIYKLSYPGGLYPGGATTRPNDHEQLGLQIVQDYIHPRNAEGQIDLVDGVIGMISVGMSNTRQEFDGGEWAFRFRANQDPATNSQLVIVNGALGGQPASTWANESASVWDLLDDAISEAGLSPSQVQIAWVKHAEAHPANIGEFPAHAEVLRDHLESIFQILRARFSNLRIAYLSSRTRSYTDDPTKLNPEPFAFESAFSVRWLIEKQLNGDPALDPNPDNGNVPWLSWGPYIWTDGEVARSDGLVWHCSDLETDLIHPSMSGETKVADQLLAFFKTDPTTVPWFLEETVIGQPPEVAILSDVTNGSAPLAVNFSALADDPDGAVTEFAWTFDDGGFSFDQDPAKIFPVPGVYDTYLTVTDNDGNTVRRTLTIEVNADGSSEPPAIIGPSVLPDGTEGSAYSVTFSASGTTPIAWHVVSGLLPPGLDLSVDGEYSGIPTEPGIFSFTIQASNSAGADLQDYQHSIAAGGGLLHVFGPMADAYVADGISSDTNFGSLDVLEVRDTGSPGKNRVSYLKFDVSNISCAIESAQLQVFLQEIGRGSQMMISLFSVEDDAWDEETVTWNQRPAVEAVLDSVLLSETGTEYTFDLTPFFETQEDSLISLALVSADTAKSQAIFDSREGAESPLLEILCVAE